MYLALTVLTLALFTVAFILPVVRLRLTTGTWVVVFHREADDLQRLVGAAVGMLLVGYLAWALLVHQVEPALLDIRRPPRWIGTAGLALMGLGTLLVTFAQAQMGRSLRIGIDDRPTPLVTSGLFAWMRNPIFTALLVFLLGVLLVTPSPWTVAGWLSAVFLIAAQVRLEERHLVRMHGTAYMAYCAEVGRFLPGLGRGCAPPPCTPAEE